MPWQVGQFAGTYLDFFPVGVPSHFCHQETLLQCFFFFFFPAKNMGFSKHGIIVSRLLVGCQVGREFNLFPSPFLWLF